MSTRATVADMATLKAHRYSVQQERFLVKGGHVKYGWTLTGPDGYPLLIDGHGGVSPTQWEAVAEGLARIELDERAEQAWQKAMARI